MLDMKTSGPKRLTPRAILLGGAGALALSGAIAGLAPSQRAFADAAPADHAITVTPSVNPTSFADVVDRVRNAVVSVKVKMNGTDNEEADNSDGDQDQQQQEIGRAHV